jgi:hypothetical protein
VCKKAAGRSGYKRNIKYGGEGGFKIHFSTSSKCIETLQKMIEINTKKGKIIEISYRPQSLIKSREKKPLLVAQLRRGVITAGLPSCGAVHTLQI